MPELDPSFSFYAEAFSTLSHFHYTIGGQVQPLTLRDIESYCRIFRIEDIEGFITVINAVDTKYLDYLNKVKK